MFSAIFSTPFVFFTNTKFRPFLASAGLAAIEIMKKPLYLRYEKVVNLIECDIIIL